MLLEVVYDESTDSSETRFKSMRMSLPDVGSYRGMESAEGAGVGVFSTNLTRMECVQL